MFEAHAWNSIRKLWPKAPSNYALTEIMSFLKSELKKRDNRFEMLIGTFEEQRLHLYERAFRGRFYLEPVGGCIISHNGVCHNAVIVSFEDKDET